MLKPDVSWFSELRVIGGAVAKGSSFPTAVVSSLAAHTFANLKEPTPDLVKALLINATERYEHDPALGWGTPYQGHLPWACSPGTVTLAWKAKLEPGANYYWNDIPIPPELIRNGKLSGSDAHGDPQAIDLTLRRGELLCIPTTDIPSLSSQR